MIEERVFVFFLYFLYKTDMCFIISIISRLVYGVGEQKYVIQICLNMDFSVMIFSKDFDLLINDLFSLLQFNLKAIE